MFADIGSDHAYLPCYVCTHDENARAIAGEVNEGPFQAAVNQVAKYALQDRIEVRKGDGLAVLKQEEVNQLTIAGMGGKLIRNILENGKEKLTTVNRIIAQPNVDAKVLREWFIANEYRLVDEMILEEDGHIYEILVADKGEPLGVYSNNKEQEILFGPYLMKEKNAAFINKWTSEREKLVRVINQMKNATEPNEDKMEQFRIQVKWMEEVL